MIDLEPIFIAHNKNEYFRGAESAELKRISALEFELVDSFKSKTFAFPAFCLCCQKSKKMLVDLMWGGQIVDGRKIPNWRERLVCPSCKLNNRQRLVATLMSQFLATRFDANIYMMEQVTPIYKWAIKSFRRHHVTGSEYLGHEYKSGDIVKGVRHEDVMNMSIEDSMIDLIISNDVLEHVPNVIAALHECFRILRRGGVMIATIPFWKELEHSLIRAVIGHDDVENILPAVFHGNPVSNEGSLVFTDFGWDLFDSFSEAGFNDAELAIYASEKYGHLGGGQMVFTLRK